MKAEKVGNPEYILTLTEEEAYLLREVVGSVGGIGPKRKITEGIYNGLTEFPELRAKAGQRVCTGSITFHGE